MHGHEVNRKDSRKHISYQVFLKTAKNSVLPFGKISQWMIVLMRWQNSAYWLHFHDNVLLELGKTGCLTSVHSAEIPSSLENSCCCAFLSQTHKCCEGLFGVLTFRVHMWGKNSSLQTNTWSLEIIPWIQITNSGRKANTKAQNIMEWLKQCGMVFRMNFHNQYSWMLTVCCTRCV